MIAVTLCQRKSCKYVQCRSRFLQRSSQKIISQQLDKYENDANSKKPVTELDHVISRKKASLQLLEMLQKTAFRSLYINSNQNRSRTMAESRGVGEKTSQDCWTLMTRAEKLLLFLLILSLVTIVALSAFIIAHFLNESNCDTSECIEASYKLLKTLDLSINPCEDFHGFICGSYIVIPEERKIDLITAEYHEKDSNLLRTVKQFYQTCTNVTAIENDNEATLSILLSQIGGWPLFMGKEWNEANFNWQQFMVQVRPWGIKSDWLLSFDYYEDDDGTNLLLIDPPKARLKSYQAKSAYYQEIIAQLAIKLGTAEPVQGQLNQMIAFGLNLSKISENALKNLEEDGDYSKVTVSKMNELWPENLLFEILNGLARGYSVFTNFTTVVVASENYLYDLHKLLMAVPKRVQANYFIWKAVETYLPFLSDEIREIYNKYAEIDSREEFCHSETVRRFHSVIEDEYVRKYKSESTTPLLETTANLIYQSYNQSEDARIDVAIEGPQGKNSGVTNIKFSSSKIIRMLNEIQFHIENEFYRCLHRKADSCAREGYFEDTEKLEAYFDSFDSTIHLPYNLVYSEWFMWDQPGYVNFAKIGRLIGDRIIKAEEEKYNLTLHKEGVNLAYEGYTKWLQINGMDKKLPVLNYTIRQLFWIHSSSPFCSSQEETSKFEEVAHSQYFKTDFYCY